MGNPRDDRREEGEEGGDDGVGRAIAREAVEGGDDGAEVRDRRTRDSHVRQRLGYAADSCAEVEVVLLLGVAVTG